MRGLNRRDRRRWLAGAAAAAGLAAAGPACARPVQRIVSVGGALTETLFALGAQGELVGVDSTSFFPEAARRLPVVGYQRALSAEGVLSLAPTLLLATEEAGPPAALRRIEAAGVAVHRLDAGHGAQGMFDRTDRLAALAGREAEGAALRVRLRADWRDALDRVAALRPADPARRPRVMFVMARSASQVRVAGRGTGADALLAYAGARNACDAFDGYRALSPEAALAAAPDAIVATEDGLTALGGVDALLRLPGLAPTPAGRDRRVVAVEIVAALGFGPRLPQAVRGLAEGLHRSAGRAS